LYTSSYFYLNDLKKYFPLKLEKNLFSKKKLKFYNMAKLNLYSRKLFYEVILNFSKKLYYCRYKNKLLFGVIGSKPFSLFIKERIKSFLRTNLHLDINNFELLNSSFDKVLYLGFQHSLYDKENPVCSRLLVNENFSVSLNFRIKLLKFNFSNVFLKRMKSELLFHFKTLIKFNLIKSYNFFTFKVWSYIFQFESLRSLQYYKMIFTDDVFYSVPNNLLFLFKFGFLLNYASYYFNFFLFKLNLAFKKVLMINPLYIDFSICPLDVATYETLNEITQILSIFYNLPNNYLIQPYKHKNSLRSLPCFISKKFIFWNYAFKDSVFVSNTKVLVFAPVSFIFYKLKFLGFVHPLKNRPMGNSRYLTFSDNSIIKNFGYISYILLFWFRMCENNNKVKLLIEFLRQSCILTLCRILDR
jgi:hypothetical protein